MGFNHFLRTMFFGMLFLFASGGLFAENFSNHLEHVFEKSNNTAPVNSDLSENTSSRNGPISGRLSVGGPNANYPSISAALNDLKFQGMSDDVVIDVNPEFGPYMEQIAIENIIGLSSQNTLTIKGNKALLSNSVAGNIGPYIMKLICSYVTIEDFIFKVYDGTSSTKNVAILIQQYSNYNTIRNNVFQLKKTFSNNEQVGILFSNSPDLTTYVQGDYKYNLIEHNTFEGGKNQIYLNGKTTSTIDRGNVIQSNRFYDFTNSAIYTSGIDSLVVLKNEMFQTAAFRNTSHTGLVRFMQVTNGASGFKIRNNRIYDISNTSTTAGGLHVFYFVNCGTLSAGNEAVIENNLVYNSTSIGQAIFCYISGAFNGFRMLHNTVALNSSNGLVNVFYLSLVSNFNNNHFYNNLINFSNGSTVLFGLGASSSYNGIKSDFNAYSGSASTTQFTSTLTYANWRSTYKSDSNSIFISQNDLHAPAYIVPYTTSTLISAGKDVSTVDDYWNYPRNNFNPSIGAFEKSFEDIQGPILILQNIAPTLNRNSRYLKDVLTTFEPSGFDSNFNIRMYYKKRSSPNIFIDNTNASDGWKFVVSNNVFLSYKSFDLNYQLLKDSIMNPGDTIDYFVVAKDIHGNYGVHNNKLTDPIRLNLGVNEIIKSIEPDYYVIADIIPDTIYVGANHPIKSLTNEKGLFQNFRNNFSNQVVQVLIDSDLIETGKYGLDEINKTTSRNKIYFDAANNKSIKITGNCKGGLIRFEGVDSVYWSSHSDSIIVENNYLSNKKDSIAIFQIAASAKNALNTSNAIHIYNTSIQANLNSIYTTGISIGRRNNEPTDQMYKDIYIINNRFSSIKNGIIFVPTLASFYTYENIGIENNKFQFDSLANALVVSNSNNVKINRNDFNIKNLVNSTLSNTSSFVFENTFSTFHFSYNKVLFEKAKKQDYNIFSIRNAYKIKINNNIIEYDQTDNNFQRLKFFLVYDIYVLDVNFNALVLKDYNTDVVFGENNFFSIDKTDSVKLRNNQFLNYTKSQHVKLGLMRYETWLRPALLIRNNLVSGKLYTMNHYLNTDLISVDSFERRVDTLMNFVFEDANIDTSLYRSRNNVLVSKGVHLPEITVDINNKPRSNPPSIGPYELDSIRVDVAIEKIVHETCIDTLGNTSLFGVVLRNNSMKRDSAEMSISIASTDTSTFKFNYVCPAISEHAIDTIFIPYQTIKDYLQADSMHVRLHLTGDENNENNSAAIKFKLGQSIVSNLINSVSDTICKDDQLSLKFKDVLDRELYWFDAASYGNLLHVGKSYLADNSSKPSVFAELKQEDKVKRIAMPKVSGYSARAVYLTLKNLSDDPLLLRYFSIQTIVGSYSNMPKVYVKNGSYIGFENNSNAWTEINVRVIRTDSGYIGFELLSGNTTILKDDSISIYLHIVNQTSILPLIFENITNSITSYSNDELQINYGKLRGGTEPFSGVLYTGYRPSVKMYYINLNQCYITERALLKINQQKNIIKQIKPVSSNILMSSGTLANPDVVCFINDNYYNIDISNDFADYKYGIDWLIIRREIKPYNASHAVYFDSDTSKRFLVSKFTLNQDSLYKVVYTYRDLRSGCILESLRYFRLSKNISRALSQTGTLKKCSIDSLELKAYDEKSYFNYYWSTGATSPRIKVIHPGKYFLTVSMNGCQSKTDSIIIENLPEKDSIPIYMDEFDTCMFRFYTDQTPNYTVEWDFGDGTKAVGFDVLHKFPENKIYKVTSRRLTSSSFCLKKNISEKIMDITCMPATVEEIVNNAISIYPNPTNDFINISIDDKIQGIEIFNLQGAKVLETKSTRINVEALSNGMYLLTVHTENGLIRTKFFKQ